MGLKKAIVTFTNQFGDVVTRHLPIKSVVFDYAGGFVEVLFAGYASEEARGKGAEPELTLARINVDPTNQGDMGLVMAVSDALWSKLGDVKFIQDYAETNDAGQQVLTLKSLTDLDAQVTEV